MKLRRQGPRLSNSASREGRVMARTDTRTTREKKREKEREGKRRVKRESGCSA